MARVDVCPKNLTKVIESSKKLRCGNDDYGNNQYLCLPNVNKTSLVEFCYNGAMGLQEKGICLQVSDGKLTKTSCVGFSSGCPETPFTITDFYKYSACQELDLDHHCYKFDPHCPPNIYIQTRDNGAALNLLSVSLGIVIPVIAFMVLIFILKLLKGERSNDGMKERNESEKFLRPKEQFQHLESDEIAESQELLETSEGKRSSLNMLKDATLEEMQRLLEEDQAFATLKGAVSRITYCIENDTGTDDVYTNILDVLRIGTIVSRNLKSSIAEVKATCSFLSIILKKDQYLLKNIKRLDDDKNYSKLPHKWKLAAEGHEESLLHGNTFLTHITEGTSKHVIDTLQNTISENEIVKFLKGLQSEAKKFICESKIKSTLELKVESAVLATQLVNLYCKIAILHSYVLWQVFCIKQIYGHDQSTTKGVFEMIDWCRNSNSDMLTCLTHPEIENAIFLSVFHISENENVDRLLQIQDIEVPTFAERLYNKEIHIQWSYSPDVALQMKHYSFRICGTTKTTTEECKFIFEPVEGREMDNIFYIRLACSGRTNRYIKMKSDGTCQAVTIKLDVGVKWKLVSLMSDPKNPNFIITSLKWPGRFLYLDSHRGEIRGKRDLEKVREKGLWKIRDC